MDVVKDSFETYLSKKDHISASALKDFLKSPKYYYYNTFEKKTTEKDIDKRHFPIGSAIHEKIMEPELFNQHFAVEQKIDKRTTEGKLAYEVYLDRIEGKTLLYSDEMELIENVAKEAKKNKEFMSIVENSYKEISYYTTDKKTGLKLKVRPDLYNHNLRLITDLKSTTDSSRKSFNSDVYKFGYNISNALYVDTMGAETYIFAACEKSAPYQLTLFGLSDDKVEQGRQLYRKALDLMKFSIDNNHWADYGEFEILKEMYDLNPDGVFEKSFAEEYFDTINNQSKIIIL